MKIEITRDEAKQLLVADENCFGEGQTGPPVRILREVVKAYPEFAKEYKYLPWACGGTA